MAEQLQTDRNHDPYYELQNYVAEYHRVGGGGDFLHAKFSEAWNMGILSLFKSWSLYVCSCYIKMRLPIL
jgi:hypothetical protein